MGRSASTISDELKRNKVKGSYNPVKAQHKAYVRRHEAKYQGMKIVKNSALHAFVEQNLMEHRSPEAIAGRIKNREKNLPRLSADSIERFLRSVYGRKIEAYRNQLRKKRKWRRKRPKAAKLKDRRFIDVRPKIIESRQRVGDIEADFVVSGKSGKGVLLTAADRKLRVSFIEKILPVSIENVHAAFIRIKKRFHEMRTITTDNDLLLTKHQELEALLGVKIYFCHPYHSWEKGTIENANGEIRKYLPKGSDISQYSKRFIRSVERRLNGRYMECLRYRTPQEALGECRKQKQRQVARRKKKK